MNYTRILDDLIVGSCLQMAEDVDRRVWQRWLMRALLLPLVPPPRIAASAAARASCRSSSLWQPELAVQDRGHGGRAHGAAAAGASYGGLAGRLMCASCASPRHFKSTPPHRALMRGQEDSDMAYFSLDLAPITERVAARGEHEPPQPVEGGLGLKQQTGCQPASQPASQPDGAGSHHC